MYCKCTCSSRIQRTNTNQHSVTRVKQNMFSVNKSTTCWPHSVSNSSPCCTRDNLSWGQINVRAAAQTSKCYLCDGCGLKHCWFKQGLCSVKTWSSVFRAACEQMEHEHIRKHIQYFLCMNYSLWSNIWPSAATVGPVGQNDLQAGGKKNLSHHQRRDQIFFKNNFIYSKQWLQVHEPIFLLNAFNPIDESLKCVYMRVK